MRVGELVPTRDGARVLEQAHGLGPEEIERAHSRALDRSGGMRGGIAADHHHLSQRVRGGPRRDADADGVVRVGQYVDGKAVVELFCFVGNVHASIVRRSLRAGSRCSTGRREG